MKDYRKVNLITVLFSCLLAFVSAIGTAYVVMTTGLDAFYKIEAICDILALVGASIYLILGYKKGIATIYKTSMFICAIHALVVTALAVNEDVKYIPVISCTISYGNIFLLSFGKDLGRKFSLGLSIVVVVLRTMGFVSSLFEGQSLFNPYSILITSQLVLSLYVLVIVYAKYEDKYSRGSK